MEQYSLVEQNIVSHDRVAAVRGTESYDARHIEIFNHHEQLRLQKALARSWRLKQTSNNRALDFGCGTGNLTRKILNLGATVFAADVSSGMLKRVGEMLPAAVQSSQLSTHLLTGEFPLPFPDGYFGFVATYSVLHHVPDYLTAVRELARVVDKGGVLYIDHEAAEETHRSPEPIGLKIHRNLHRPALGIPQLIRRWRTRRISTETDLAELKARVLAAEGDIHVFADDYIEWNKISTILSGCGFSESKFKSYLACTEKTWFAWRYWVCRSFVANTGIYVGMKTVAI